LAEVSHDSSLNYYCAEKFGMKVTENIKTHISWQTVLFLFRKSWQKL